MNGELKMKKKLSAVLFSLVLVVGLLPTTAWAEATDDTTATSLPDAVDGVITLTEDVDLTTTKAMIVEGENVTLDLNGHEIKAANTESTGIEVYGSLTLKDSTDTAKNGTGTGKIWSDTEYKSTPTGYCVIRVFGNGSFTMDSGLIDTATAISDNTNRGNFAVGFSNLSGNTATVTINGGHIKAGWYAVAGNGSSSMGVGNIIVNGGILESVADYGLYLPQNGTTTINNGVIYGEAGGVALNRGTLIVNDGTITSKGTGDTGTWGDGTGNLNTAAVNVNAKYGDASVVINGGKLVAEKNALLLTNNTSHTSTISVLGGTFSSDPSQYVDSTKNAVKTENGYVIMAKDSGAVKDESGTTTETKTEVTETGSTVTETVTDTNGNTTVTEVVRDTDGNVTTEVETSTQVTESEGATTTVETKKVADKTTGTVTETDKTETKTEDKTTTVETVTTTGKDDTAEVVTTKTINDIANNVTATTTVKDNTATTEAEIGTGDLPKTVTVDATAAEKDAENVSVAEVTLPAETVSELKDAVNDKIVDQVVISTDVATLTIDNTALKTLTSVNGDLVLQVAQKEIADDADKAVKAVYELTATVGAESVFKDATKDANGSIAISVASDAPTNGNTFVVYYVTDDGVKTAIPSEYKDGLLTWTTNHFSTFEVQEVAVTTPDIDKKTDTKKDTDTKTDVDQKTNSTTETKKTTETDDAQTSLIAPKKDTKAPATGDDSNLTIWIAMLAIGGSAATATLMAARKRKQDQ